MKKLSILMLFPLALMLGVNTFAQDDSMEEEKPGATPATPAEPNPGEGEAATPATPATPPEKEEKETSNSLDLIESNVDFDFWDGFKKGLGMVLGTAGQLLSKGVPPEQVKAQATAQLHEHVKKLTAQGAAPETMGAPEANSLSLDETNVHGFLEAILGLGTSILGKGLTMVSGLLQKGVPPEKAADAAAHAAVEAHKKEHAAATTAAP